MLTISLKRHRRLPFCRPLFIDRILRDVSVTVRLAGAEADIHSGADAATAETVLRVLKSC